MASIEPTQLDFRTHPDRYRHWSISTEGPIARLEMNVDENAPQFGDYELKLNSYDIGVDIELYDAVQRLRFEHPEVRAVILTSARSACSAQAPTFGCWVPPPIRTR